MKRLLLTLIPIMAQAQIWGNMKYANDKETVSKDWHDLDVAYHYAWQDLQVISGLSHNAQVQNILDVGPGAGHWCRLWRELYPVARITAVEPSVEMSQRLVEQGLVDSMLNAYIQDTRFGADFEIVSAIGVLHHILDDGKLVAVIRHLVGCLADDGVMFIGTRIVGKTETEGKYRRFRSLDDWHAMFAGLNVDVHIDYVTPPKGFRKHLDLITVRHK